MFLQEQKSWGGLLAVDHFFSGVGGGTFLFGFWLNILHLSPQAANLGAFIGSVLVLIGTFFLLIDLTIKVNAFRLLANPKSWIMRGTIMLAVMIIFSLAYSVPAFWISGYQTTWYGWTIGIIAAIAALLTILEPGFILNATKAIPFWSNPILTVIYLFSGLSMGYAMVLFTVAAVAGIDVVNVSSRLVPVNIALILLQLLLLYLYFDVGLRGNEACVKSVRLLTKMSLALPFWLGLIVIGFIIPLILEGITLGLGTSIPIVTFSIIKGILLLWGGFLLRYVILKAGVRVLPFPGGTISVAGWMQS